MLHSHIVGHETFRFTFLSCENTICHERLGGWPLKSSLHTPYTLYRSADPRNHRLELSPRITLLEVGNSIEF